MRNFLANILGRYTQNKPIVRPRSPGIFENQPSWPGESHAETIPEIQSQTFFQTSSETKKPESDLNQKPTHKFQPEKAAETEFDHEEPQIIRPVSVKENVNTVDSRQPESIKKVIHSKHQTFKTAPKIPSLNRRIISKIIPEKLVERDANSRLNNLSVSNIEPPTASSVDTNIPRSNPVKGSYFQLDTRQSQMFERGPDYLTDIEPTPTNTQPDIKIHIGRIEIKAVKQEVSKKTSIKQKPKPGASLEQFLKKRGGNSK